MRLLLVAALGLLPISEACAQYVGPYAQPQYPYGYGYPQSDVQEQDEDDEEEPYDYDEEEQGYAYNGRDYREEYAVELASLPRGPEHFERDTSCAYGGYTTLEIAAATVTVMLESRGEPAEGRRRVAYTIFQRGARDRPDFGGSNLYKVVTKKSFNRRTGRWVWQFSPMRNPRIYRWSPQDLENAKEAVLDVMCGRWKPQPQEACMLYFRTVEGHFRNLVPVAVVGRHRFYCEPREVYAAYGR